MTIPYYIQVAATIRKRILADEYSDGEILPSSEQFEKEFAHVFEVIKNIKNNNKLI